MAVDRTDSKGGHAAALPACKARSGRWRRSFTGFSAALIATTGLLGVAVDAAAQEVPDRLTLEDAVELATAHNPTFLSTLNDRSSASWGVREAYGAFLPELTASTSAAYTQAGTQRIGTLDFGAQSTDWYSSSYSLAATWTFNGSTIFGVPNARARRTATDARVQAAEFDLASVVAFEYMSVLKATEAVAVAQRQVERAEQNLQVVRTRVSSGAAAGADGSQAAVDLGRTQARLIEAERDLTQARLLLGERIGLAVGPDVVLGSTFEVFEPDFDLDTLLERALSAHPSLGAYRAEEAASRAQARQTSTSQYFPTLRLTTALSGNTLEALNRDFVVGQAQGLADSRVSNCEFSNALDAGIAGGLPGYTQQDCTQYVFTDQTRLDALAANDVFPLDFTRLPVTVRVSLSIPVFTGFRRQRQISEANSAAEDAVHARRSEELRLRTAVTGAYASLRAAHRLLEAEAENRALAEQLLQFQQRRYALGAADLLLLLDAQTTLAEAEQAYLDAVYDFHYNLIALEASVGGPLRAG